MRYVIRSVLYSYKKERLVHYNIKFDNSQVKIGFKRTVKNERRRAEKKRNTSSVRKYMIFESIVLHLLSTVGLIHNKGNQIW